METKQHEHYGKAGALIGLMSMALIFSNIKIKEGQGVKTLLAGVVGALCGYGIGKRIKNK